MPRAKKTEKKEDKAAETAAKSAKETKEAKKAKAEAAEAAKTAETAAAAVALEEPAETGGGKKKGDKYYEAVGRRKTAVARVRISTRGGKEFTVNGVPLEKYFPNPQFKAIIEAPFVKMSCDDRFKVSARVKGGGTNAQAEAIRHGISRALVMFNLDFKKRLKKAGYLTRDPRMKERKKPGLKRARKAPQWAKR